jgi:hypothetical protein
MPNPDGTPTSDELATTALILLDSPSTSVAAQRAIAYALLALVEHFKEMAELNELGP